MSEERQFLPGEDNSCRTEWSILRGTGACQVNSQVGARDIRSSMALITVREVWKRVVLSAITLPLTAAGSYIIKNTLVAWGILDDFSTVLGNWLKINVTPTIPWSADLRLIPLSQVGQYVV